MSALDSERPHRAHGVQSAKQSKAPILAETEVAESEVAVRLPSVWLPDTVEGTRTSDADFPIKTRFFIFVNTCD